MTPTNKGNYGQCNDCIYQLSDDSDFPCSHSHKKVRTASGVKLERNFQTCGLRRTEMYVYTVKFDGYYPGSAVALITAESIEMAMILINTELESMGLHKIKKKDIKLQDVSTRRVDILTDGNYVRRKL